MKPLRKRALGNTGIQIARLSLGTVKLGRDRGVKYPDPVSIPDDKAARELLDCALDLGINTLDTAPAYGTSESRLGRLIADERERWVLCTKVGEEYEDGQSSFNFTPEHCRFSVERSLTRLGTDVLDIVLIHSDGNDREILQTHGTLDALKDLKQEGKIRAVGISHKTPAGGALAISMGADVIMATLNRDYQAEAGLIGQAAAQGCGVLIKKALRSGHGQAQDLADVAAHAGVHSIVVGTTNPAHLRANARVLIEAGVD